MLEAMLKLCDEGGGWQVTLNPAGTLFGRSPACDVVIASRDVSWRHARIFQGPARCWMVEDLGSSNGTFVNGRQILSCPVLPGDIIEIGPASLWLDQRLEARSDATVVLPMPNIMVADFGPEVFYDRPRLENCSTSPCPERLGRLRDRLTDMTDLISRYTKVCRALAAGPKTPAVVLRVPSTSRPLPETPEVLAYHFGGHLDDTAARSADAWCPSHRAFRVSHRLLDAVRTGGRSLMTKSIFSCDTEVTISLIDEHSPRAIICLPLGPVGDLVDLLYADSPIREHCEPGPDIEKAIIPSEYLRPDPRVGKHKGNENDLPSVAEPVDRVPPDGTTP